MCRKIKFLIMDVDGTLTDGKIYMGNDGEMMKAFDIKDGCGIHDILIPAGIRPVIITGRKSRILENRCSELGITELHQGIRDKLSKLYEILERYTSIDGCVYDLSNTAYVGDDINDLSAMRAVKTKGGVVGCPADAVTEVMEIADLVADNIGGNGAVREVIEWLIRL